jgi:hypothetical protein
MIEKRNEYLEEQVLTNDVAPFNPTENTSNTQTIPIIYGRRKVTGQVIFTYPGNNVNDIYFVVALSEGTIAGVTKTWINGSLSVLEPLAHDTITGADGIYSGLAKFSLMDGRTYVPTNSLLGEVVSNKIFPSLAYVVVKLTKDPNRPDIFSDGIPQLEFEVIGVLGDNPSPGDVIKDLMTSTRYGLGISASDVDVTDANTYTEQTVAYTIGSNTLKLFTCNTVIDTGKTLNQNIQSILNEFNLIMPQINGVWYVKAEATGGSPTAVTEADVIGQIEQIYPDANVRLDTVYAEFSNGNVDYSNTTVGVYFDGTNYRTIYEVYGTTRTKKLSLNSITNFYQARRLCESTLKKSTSAVTMTCTLSKSYISLDVGDLISLSGFTPDSFDGTYKIVRKTVNYDFTVTVETIKYDSANYAGSLFDRAEVTKFLKPTGNGYEYYPKFSVGQTPVQINLPPIQRPPGEIRTPEPDPENRYTIAGAAELDDNTDWYMAYSETGTDQDSQTYNSGVRLKVNNYLSQYGYLHGEFALVYKYFERPQYQNIAFAYPVNATDYGYVERIGRQINVYNISINDDFNEGRAFAISGNYKRSFTTSFNDFFGRPASLLTRDSKLNGLYTHLGVQNGDDEHDFGLNYYFTQKKTYNPFLKAYANSYPIRNPLGTLRLKFFGQAKNNGAWEYIGRKDITYNYSNIASKYIRSSAKNYRGFTGSDMPT